MKKINIVSLKSKKNGIPPPAPVTITTLPSNLSKSLLDEVISVSFILCLQKLDFYKFKIKKIIYFSFIMAKFNQKKN